MKKKLIEKITKVMLVIPIPVFLVIVAIMNYGMGSIMAKINKEYSSITIETSKEEFFVRVISLISVWCVIMIFNALITKVSNMKLLNKNYMAWITRLTYSKVSSITKVGTGGISNAIHTISHCNKEMVNEVINVLPYIMPFLVICKEEYIQAGVLPILINAV